MSKFERKFVVSPEGEASIEPHKPEEIERARLFAEKKLREKAEAWAERHAKKGGLSKGSLLNEYEQISERIYAKEAEKAQVRALERIEEYLDS